MAPHKQQTKSDPPETENNAHNILQPESITTGTSEPLGIVNPLV
ncbi:unnamed protein product, partial [Rotaria magnacalcarata]